MASVASDRLKSADQRQISEMGIQMIDKLYQVRNLHIPCMRYHAAKEACGSYISRAMVLYPSSNSNTNSRRKPCTVLSLPSFKVITCRCSTPERSPQYSAVQQYVRACPFSASKIQPCPVSRAMYMIHTRFLDVVTVFWCILVRLAESTCCQMTEGVYTC